MARSGGLIKNRAVEANLAWSDSGVPPPRRVRARDSLVVSATREDGALRMRIQVRLLLGSTKERNFLLLCNGNDITSMNYTSWTSALARFFFGFILKQSIAVPSGNHNVLSARSDLTHQMECFPNSACWREASVSDDDQRLEAGRPPR